MRKRRAGGLVAGLLVIAVISVAVAEAHVMRPSARRDPRTGTLAGHVAFARHRDDGVVRAFDTRGRLVGRQSVRWGHADYRFALQPGLYEIKVFLRGPGSTCGPNQQQARVRPQRTTRISFSEGCNY